MNNQRTSLKSLLVGFGVIVMLLLVLALVWNKISPKSQVPTSNTVASSQRADPQQYICSLQSTLLVCLNPQTYQATSFPLPAPGGADITNLAYNLKTGQFLASTAQSVWLLSGRLQVIRQLSFPAALHPIAGTASWAPDASSILLELDNDDNSRQIYRYSLVTSIAQQLTTNGDNTTPFETRDGSIVYEHYGAGDNGFLPYFMNAALSETRALTSLSNPELLPDSYATEFAGLSYDAGSDTIYVDNFADTGHPQGSLEYETAAMIEQGRPPTIVDLAVQTSGDHNVIVINQGSIVWPTNITATTRSAQIINLHDGHIEHLVQQYGIPVGLVPISKL